MSELAPVVIFAYRRAEHLRNTLTSLMHCDDFEQSPVILYCDGPRDVHEVEAAEETRLTAQALLDDRAEYHFNSDNTGLAKSIITGVSEVVSRYGRAIVIEDDLELAPTFLTFMNHALDCYVDDQAVYQVSGYMFEVQTLKNLGQPVFLPFINSSNNRALTTIISDEKDLVLRCPSKLEITNHDHRPYAPDVENNRSLSPFY